MWALQAGAGAGGLRAGRMMSLHSALRAQMGVAVPALSVPKEESRSSEPCLLFFGIVDFLQVCLTCGLLRCCEAVSMTGSDLELGKKVSVALPGPADSIPAPAAQMHACMRSI